MFITIVIKIKVCKARIDASPNRLGPRYAASISWGHASQLPSAGATLRSFHKLGPRYAASISWGHATQLPSAGATPQCKEVEVYQIQCFIFQHWHIWMSSA